MLPPPRLNSRREAEIFHPTIDLKYQEVGERFASRHLITPFKNLLLANFAFGLKTNNKLILKSGNVESIDIKINSDFRILFH